MGIDTKKLESLLAEEEQLCNERDGLYEKKKQVLARLSAISNALDKCGEGINQLLYDHRKEIRTPS